MTEPDRDREDLIAFWRRLQKAAFEMASRNVAITLRDAAWLYAKGYDIDAPIETMVNFIVYVDRLELGGAAVTPSPKTENTLKIKEGGSGSRRLSSGRSRSPSSSKRRRSNSTSKVCAPLRLVIGAPKSCRSSSPSTIASPSMSAPAMPLTCAAESWPQEAED